MSTSVQAFLESKKRDKSFREEASKTLRIALKSKKSNTDALPLSKEALTKLKQEGLKTQIELSKNAIEFGLFILNDYNSYDADVYDKGAKILQFDADNGCPSEGLKIWERDDFYAVLLFIFGVERIDYLKKAWFNIPNRAYQSGWTRRSFRAPNRPDKYFMPQLDLLYSSVPDANHKEEFYDLSLREALLADAHIEDIGVHPYLLAEMVDAKDSEFLTLCERIIEGKEPIGMVGARIIRGLLSSESSKAWKLVEQLLLNAQREEGLRQTILESLDQASLSALPYFIRVILDNDLSRFSSVARGLDTWTGMGWHGARQEAVEKCLRYALDGFENPKTIAKSIQSDDNLQVFMALWVQSCFDMEQTEPLLQPLMQQKSMEKQCVAIHFAEQLGICKVQFRTLLASLYSDHIEAYAMAWNWLSYTLPEAIKSKWISAKEIDNAFVRCQTLADTITIKRKDYPGIAFSWLDPFFDKSYIYKMMGMLIQEDMSKFDTVMSYIDDMDVESRTSIVESLLPDFFGYNNYKKTQKKAEPITLTTLQRRAAMQLLNDRSEYVHTACERALMHGGLLDENLPEIEAFLRKSATGIRKRVCNILVRQADPILQPTLKKLLVSKNTQQRLAGLEIAFVLRNSPLYKTQISTWVGDYKQRKKLTKAEKESLKRFTNDDSKKLPLNKDNGWGMFDPNIQSDYLYKNKPPTLRKNNFFAQCLAKHPYGFSKSLEAIQKDVDALAALYEQHKEHEYRVTWFDGTSEMIMLGNYIRPTLPDNRDFEKRPPREKFESYPLWEEWEKWYQKAKWQPRDLFLFFMADDFYTRKGWDKKGWFDFLREYLFIASEQSMKQHKKIKEPLIEIMYALSLAYPFEKKNAFCVGATQRIFANIPEEILKHKITSTDADRFGYIDKDHGNGWQTQRDFFRYLNTDTLDALAIEDNDFKEYWGLLRWQQYAGLAENIPNNLPPLKAYARAYQQKLISKDELISSILMHKHAIENIQEYPKRPYYAGIQWIKDFPFLQEVVQEICDYCLDIELQRGDLDTPVTQFVHRFERVEGINRLVSLLQGLGKKGVYVTHLYNWDKKNKRQLFSRLVKACYPKKDDTQTHFNATVKKSKLPDATLVSLAIYAPQWQQMVSNYLKWDGFDSGLWWMRAHTKVSDYENISPEDESEIARYSNVDATEFEMGAVDIDWFNSAYGKLGKQRWQQLYDAAKYVSHSNGHRRAKLYSDVLTNQLKIRAVTNKIKDKRDQDYVRLYGLVPLSKTAPEKDVLARYQYLQQFKKESRQFGSQRQGSEAKAVQVAMDNLARNAGYADPNRLSWAMESKTIQAIFAKDTSCRFDQTTIDLRIDSNGKAFLYVEKDGKTLKSIPAKYRKEKVLAALKKQKKILIEQFRRARRSLEEAMVRGDTFTAQELGELFAHPVIGKHLQALVFVVERRKKLSLGFYKDGALQALKGKAAKIKADELIRIAHCTDFHRASTWTDYQRYCFDEQLVQPFKQIFRELYVPTPDELAEKTLSRRYAGHQVKPAQTMALLKTRGWRTDYSEGLQKVYHKLGFGVKLYAMADWFSPSDAENPTLEVIVFESLKERKKIPLKDIDARIFSEVMRDVDLVVSVAHAGGVDPEASQSSIEMRAVLVTESMRLFKQDNVRIKGVHALVSGALANYSVHLGSAVTHQIPGSYLSILPTHSQHRGRIFLPFMDDDPRTAEIISKVLMLSRDKKIKDPTILKQIDAQ